jgi:acyl-CoA reductase-like NAD-dependent aldehyde dehydrogenase
MGVNTIEVLVHAIGSQLLRQRWSSGPAASPPRVAASGARRPPLGAGSGCCNGRERRDYRRRPLAPSIAVAPDQESELVREELFGPLLALAEVTDLNEAIEFVNGSRYGNAGAIFTRSGDTARRYRYRVEAGMLGKKVVTARWVATDEGGTVTLTVPPSRASSY